jgi:cytochrome P450
MNEIEDVVINGLPTDRIDPFQITAELTALQRERPIVKMRYPDDHVGWLVTSYALAKVVLTDARFSARHELRHSPVPVPYQPAPSAPGIFIGMDAPDHTRYRKHLSKPFTARQVRDLNPLIERIVAQRLDSMAELRPPVDLMREFALPIPSQVICEILGASAEYYAKIEGYRALTIDPGTPPEKAAEAGKATMMLVQELVQEKKRQPADDLLSTLISSDSLTDSELAGIAMLMLIAGHETTASMLGFSAYLLLRREDLRARVSADPTVTESLVDELLRYIASVQFASRAALADVDISGVRIKAGDTVTISISAVNRDPGHFTSAGDFRVADRGTGTHLAFGHGAHQCLGQNLAQAEMVIGLTALLRRFPALRLAAPEDELTMSYDRPTISLHQLPILW